MSKSNIAQKILNSKKAKAGRGNFALERNREIYLKRKGLMQYEGRKHLLRELSAEYGLVEERIIIIVRDFEGRLLRGEVSLNA